MIEKILDNVVGAMTPYLNQEQIEHLRNILFINFHNIEVCEQCTEIVPTGMNGNEQKLRMFIASKKAVNRQDNTLKQYAYEIRKVLSFLDKNIEDITSMDLRYYCCIMREQRHIKVSTLQTRLHYLNSFWDFLVSEEVVKTNPVKKIGVLKIEKRIKKPFSPDEMEAIRVGCNTLRDRALIEFLYSTGLRVSELVSLNVKDIEMNKQELIVYGKGSKERKSYITDTAKFYLKLYLNSRCQTENISVDTLQDSPLFVTLDSPHNRITIAGVQYTLKQIGKRSGVTNVHPHRFRRTIATNLLNRGMPIEQVKTFLGHEKLDTTMIYCTVKNEFVQISHRNFA